MRVLVTGNRGYIGTVLTPMLEAAGHEVVGLDSDLYERCTFAPGGELPEVPTILKDIREVEVADLERVADGVRPDDILIVRTDWTDRSWGRFPDFFTKSPYLTPDAAEWLIAQRPRAIGFDFFEEYSARLPSFGSEDFVCHRILLGADVPMLEQITGLGRVGRQRFDFFAPFYKIAGTEGAPARYFAIVE